VYSMHQNISAYLEKEGVEVTLISAGEFKTEGNQFEPLSDEARGTAQVEVDAYHDMFVRSVARGRAVPVETVRESFGKGRMVLGKEAVSRGMADRVATIDEVLLDLERRRVESQRASAALADQAARMSRLREKGAA